MAGRRACGDRWQHPPGIAILRDVTGRLALFINGQRSDRGGQGQLAVLACLERLITLSTSAVAVCCCKAILAARAFLLAAVFNVRTSAVDHGRRFDFLAI